MWSEVEQGIDEYRDKRKAQQTVWVGLRDGGKLQAGATLPPEYHISVTLMLFLAPAF